jgi:hypothetical protein
LIEKINLGKQVTKRIAIKNGTNAKKKHLKIESKRVSKAENFIEGK